MNKSDRLLGLQVFAAFRPPHHDQRYRTQYGKACDQRDDGVVEQVPDRPAQRQ